MRPMENAAPATACVRLSFVGRVEPPGLSTPRFEARVRQVHGIACLEVNRSGLFGEADALWTSQPMLVLEVVTADCVPVLLRGTRAIAAVHAGWRGLAAGILGVAADAIGGVEEAWIGPAIGACCYEVGSEVAECFAHQHPHAVLGGRAGKAHLDLQRIAAEQLGPARATGRAPTMARVPTMHRVAVCTRCDPAWWSYRREGVSSGRNRSRIWLEPERRT